MINPEVETHWILESVTGRDWHELVAGERPIDENLADRARGLAKRRATGEPLQYVIGVAGFRRLELAVGPGVLIPRPETEVVTEIAMGKLPRGGTIVDVGTGSGAIALAVADERPDAVVYATESSSAALEWAHKNRAALEKNVELINCDLLDGLPSDLRGHADVVVSNPPYVPYEDRRLLPRDVVDHEPHEALFADKEGLAVLERVAADARDWLRPGGWVVLEIGDGQGPAVATILEDLSYDPVELHLDLTDRERICTGRRP